MASFQLKIKVQFQQASTNLAKQSCVKKNLINEGQKPIVESITA